MPASDLPLLVEAAEEAGKIAARFRGPETQFWEKPGDEGPVSEADIEVNRALESRLRSARPDYGWLSEESDDDGERLRHDRAFVIDPIDGTRNFLDGGRTWALSLAVVENGAATAAVILLPMRDLAFAAGAGAGATLNGKPIRVSGATDLASCDVLASRTVEMERHWRDGKAPPFRRSHRASIAYRMCCVAQGRFDAILTLRPTWEWDAAAGSLILAEAGATCTDRTGLQLKFNNPVPRLDGVLAANSEIHSRLLAALA